MGDGTYVSLTPFHMGKPGRMAGQTNNNNNNNQAETPGLWKHASRPIQFVLVVDGFFVEYVGKEHADHLANVLKKYHTIIERWTAKKFLGVDWSEIVQRNIYRTCRSSIKIYINELLFKVGHPNPK